LRDYGNCGRTARDSGSLFVTQVGPDRHSGQNGWVYKVDGRSASSGAADPAGPFGDGRRLRGGQRAVWFWCVMGARGCQRSLAVARRWRTWPLAGAWW
jgi:hypothetical protein